MLKWIKRGLLALGALIALVLALDVLTYSRSGWLADYERLKGDMSQGYANLDWVVEKRGVDLAALDRRTTDAIGSAYSRVRAFLALQAFVGAFRDPHLRLALESAPQASRSGTTSDADSPAGADCGAAGYADDAGDFHPALSSLPGWQPLPEGSFPAAIAGKTGFLRIGSFREEAYAEACRQAFRAGIGARELQLAAREKLQVELRARAVELKKRGATKLVIDLTGNGGGSEWASEAASLFSDRMLRRQSARIVGPRCDRSAVWSGQRPPCPVFAPSSEETIEMQGAGAWAGPLLILADRHTASAAEDFIVWLRGSGALRLAGERTLGAGCGYVDGGSPTYFRSAPVVVHMPNCARFLSDGTNEIEGIEPDAKLPMDGEDAAVATALRPLLG